MAPGVKFAEYSRQQLTPENGAGYVVVADGGLSDRLEDSVGITEPVVPGLVSESDLETGDSAHSSESWAEVDGSLSWGNDQDCLLLLEGHLLGQLPSGMRAAAFYGYSGDNGLVDGLLRVVREDHAHPFAAAALVLPNGNLVGLGAKF